jgi:hypothetical protein
MSLIIDIELDSFKTFLTSKKFLSKLFSVDKSVIKRENDTIAFKQEFNYDVVTEHCKKFYKNKKTIYSDMPDLLVNYIKTIKIFTETSSKIIKETSDTIIVKYTTQLREPEYFLTVVGESTKVILYAQFSKNKNNPAHTNVHLNKKFLNSSDIDNDDIIIDSANNDIITNIYQQDKLNINSNILMLSESFLGQEFVNNVALPILNNIFNSLFEYIQEIYIDELSKFLTKKNITIYSKKK